MEEYYLNLAIFSNQASGVFNLGEETFGYICQQHSLNHTKKVVFGRSFWLEEEQSYDAEIGHTNETINFLKISNGQEEHIFASEISTAGTDTISIRQQHINYPIDIITNGADAHLNVALGEVISPVVIKTNFVGAIGEDISSKIIWETSDPHILWKNPAGKLVGMSPGLVFTEGHYQGYSIKKLVLVH